MRRLHLVLRTPGGVVVDGEVSAVCAEDEAGWFGIWPGRIDVVAVLPPGLLTYRDDVGETFVALSGGLLELRDGTCRVMVREATCSRDLGEVAVELGRALSQRRSRGERRRGVFAELEREALARMAREART